MPEEYKACGAQLNYPPEAKGIPYDDWVKTRPVASRGEIQAWLNAHAPGNKEKLEAVAASTGRDNYGLVGKSGKKAKKHDPARWESFQGAIKS